MTTPCISHWKANGTHERVVMGTAKTTEVRARDTSGPLPVPGALLSPVPDFANAPDFGNNAIDGAPSLNEVIANMKAKTGRDEFVFHDGKYSVAGRRLGELVDEKQKAYGDSFGKAGKVLEILYPDGVKPEQYKNFLAVTRIVDKLFRIATDKDAFGESPFGDIAGYGLLGMVNP